MLCLYFRLFLVVLLLVLTFVLALFSNRIFSRSTFRPITSPTDMLCVPQIFFLTGPLCGSVVNLCQISSQDLGFGLLTRSFRKETSVLRQLAVDYIYAPSWGEGDLVLLSD